MIQRPRVGIGQIRHVNVVADAGPIRGRIIGAEDLHAGNLPGHGHQHPRNEVGFRFVILADQAILR